jgi:hypothetical protein
MKQYNSKKPLIAIHVPDNVEILNTTKRRQQIPYDLKPVFMDNHRLEYAVYYFARNNYNR